jgi:hypothetical protein
MEKRNVDKAKGGLQGEGDYEAARDYNERTRRFIKSGRVDEAAQEAAPHTDEEAAELEKAEAIGKSHAKDEKASDAGTAKREKSR